MIKFGNLSDLGSVVEALRRLNEDSIKVIVRYPNPGENGFGGCQSALQLVDTDIDHLFVNGSVPFPLVELKEPNVDRPSWYGQPNG
jgi:hypothetical protein